MNENENNKEFYDLLHTLIEEQTFNIELIDGQIANCKQLNTAQLTELIRTVIDSPLTQSVFNTTSNKIFRDCVTLPLNYSLNTIDRLLFLLETRKQSLSPTITLVNSEDSNATFDIETIKQSILKAIKENSQVFADSLLTHEKFGLVVGVPYLSTEDQLNEEIYKNTEIDTSNKENLRAFIGEAFLNEIAKHLKTLTLENDKTLDFSTISFTKRLEILNTLPASLIQKIVVYIEKQKSLVDQCLMVDGFYLSVDSTFFNLN